MALPTPTDITLYTSQTPNGIKISILLEELGLDYKVHPIEITKNTQKEPWFLKINPNGRIPALTDTFTDGQPIHLFESGAIMQYLVDRYDKDRKVSYEPGSRGAWETTCWLMWQMGGQGPMQGQSNHFKRYAPEKIEYGINRYGNETRRLYRAMDTALATRPYLAGDKLTVADIASWGWTASAKWAGIDISEFPHLKEWRDRLLKREGFERGRHVPTRHTALEKEALSEEELDKQAKGASAWILQGMKEDAKKN